MHKSREMARISEVLQKRADLEAQNRAKVELEKQQQKPQYYQQQQKSDSNDDEDDEDEDDE